MIKLKQLLESSAKDRLRKRVAGYLSPGKMSKEAEKIRSVLNSLPSEEKAKALKGMEESGKDLYKWLYVPGDDEEEYKDSIDGGEVLRQIFYNLEVAPNPSKFADLKNVLKGAMNDPDGGDSLIDKFASKFIHTYNKKNIERIIAARAEAEYSFEVELYILMLELFTEIYEIDFFGQKIS
jgi:hypothetical protein